MVKCLRRVARALKHACAGIKGAHNEIGVRLAPSMISSVDDLSVARRDFVVTIISIPVANRHDLNIASALCDLFISSYNRNKNIATTIQMRSTIKRAVTEDDKPLLLMNVCAMENHHRRGSINEMPAPSGMSPLS